MRFYQKAEHRSHITEQPKLLENVSSRSGSSIVSSPTDAVLFQMPTQLANIALKLSEQNRDIIGPNGLILCTKLVVPEATKCTLM